MGENHSALMEVVDEEVGELHLEFFFRKKKTRRDERQKLDECRKEKRLFSREMRDRKVGGGGSVNVDAPGRE